VLDLHNETMMQKLRRVVSVLLLSAFLAIGFGTPSYAAGIPAGEWKLISLNGTSPVGQRPISLKIDDKGINGSSGCNFYFSSFSADDSSQITIRDIATTRLICPDYQQELRYLQALEGVKIYRTDGTTLSLTNPDENIYLKFSKS
jgi:heat shock protein HslJ